MAETDRPCRCRSRIMTTSPSLITVPSPPAGRDSIDDRSAARPPGARPGRSTLTASLGKIQTALLGKITPASTPVEQQTRRDAVLAGHERDRQARLQGFLHEPDLLRHRPPPAALHRGDHLDALDLLRHSRTPRLMPRPSRYATCPVETGAAPRRQTRGSIGRSDGLRAL